MKLLHSEAAPFTQQQCPRDEHVMMRDPNRGRGLLWLAGATNLDEKSHSMNLFLIVGWFPSVQNSNSNGLLLTAPKSLHAGTPKGRSRSVSKDRKTDQSRMLIAAAAASAAATKVHQNGEDQF